MCPGLYLPEEGASFQLGCAREVKTEAGGQDPQVGQRMWEERKGKRSLAITSQVSRRRLTAALSSPMTTA